MRASLSIAGNYMSIAGNYMLIAGNRALSISRLQYNDRQYAVVMAAMREVHEQFITGNSSVDVDSAAACAQPDSAHSTISAETR